MDRERLKEQVGRHAAGLVEDGMRVGLGTGSTVRFTILALGERAPRITCVATSERTRAEAVAAGLHIVAPDEVLELDLAIDGADEVSPAFDLVKGGGGAHTREKIVARMAKRFVVVVDEAKLVDELGAFGVPVEVLPFAPATVARWLRDLGAQRVERRAEPSDAGNVLMTAHFGPIADPTALARELAQVPGLVEHGLFGREMVERVLVAGPSGVREAVRRA